MDQRQQQQQQQQQQQPPYQYEYRSSQTSSVQQNQQHHEQAPPYHQQLNQHQHQQQQHQQHQQQQQQQQHQVQEEQQPQKTDAEKALPVYTSPKRVWIAKLSLRIIIALVCIILVGLSASLVVAYDIGSLVLLAPPAFVSFVWSVCEAICIVGRGGHRGIHPGACVGVDLILWLGFTVSTTFYGLLGYTNANFYHYYAYSWPESYNTPTETNSARAALAFSLLLLLLHFTLFVIACVETNIRNRKTRVIYVTADGMPMQPPPNQLTGMPPSYQAACMPPQVTIEPIELLPVHGGMR